MNMYCTYISDQYSPPSSSQPPPSQPNPSTAQTGSAESIPSPRPSCPPGSLPAGGVGHGVRGIVHYHEVAVIRLVTGGMVRGILVCPWPYTEGIARLCVWGVIQVHK